MAEQWFVESPGGVEGPLTDSGLRARAAVGLLCPSDRVSPDRSSWVPAGSVPGLTFPFASQGSTQQLTNPNL
ncbi:MAG: DUF4339 domain-containing protein, partial [Gemmataceae bacterium]|nr:DUF4339 domain-containing protein [Gemmataceae bacterium]